MMLVEETSVPDSSLPVAKFKDHLRLGTGFSDASIQDSVLIAFLRAAVSSIEARTAKILIERDFSWNLTAWKEGDGQTLPIAPVQSIAAVIMIEADGSETVAMPDRYHLVQDHQRPKIIASHGGLPAIPSRGSVEIRFRAGLGDEWGDLPADLGQAVLLLAAHYYEYRAETGLGEGCMPFGVSALIQRYKPMRLTAGGAR